MGFSAIAPLEELRVLSAYGATDIGPVRKTNEDNFASDEGLQLFVVADGMGGHAAGEVASSLAVETIVGFIRRSESEGDGEFSWPYGIDPALSVREQPAPDGHLPRQPPRVSRGREA